MLDLTYLIIQHGYLRAMFDDLEGIKSGDEGRGQTEPAEEEEEEAVKSRRSVSFESSSISKWSKQTMEATRNPIVE